MTQPDFEVGKAAGRLAGWRGGDGPAVVMLHGGPGLSEYMAGLVPELADSYATVRYQQRGVEPSSLSGPFSVESQLGDLLTVLDGLDIEQAVILGHSWGGHLALHLLASHPERVRAALVVDPLGAVADGGEADLGRILNERAAPVAAARAKELDDRSMRGEGTAEDALEGLALVWPGYFAHPEQAPPMPPMQISIPCYAQTWDSIHQHFARRTLAEALPKVTVPTHFLLGAESPIPPRHGLETAALIPGAQVTVVTDCGHIPWLERSGLVRAALDKLVAQLN